MPLVEVRLRVPFGRATLDPPFVARAALLSQTLFSGTADMSTVDIAAALQTVGGALSAGVDPDRLLVSGNGLASGLDRILEILADVLRGATYPEGEVTTERARLIDRIQVAQSQPSHLARVALLRRMYGDAPVRRADAGHRRRRRAGHGRTGRAARRAAAPGRGDAGHRRRHRRRGRRWTWPRRRSAPGTAPAPGEELPPVPRAARRARSCWRTGRARCSRRCGWRCPRSARTHPDHAALQLANLVFGGYFSSRWVENIREDKGYTYSPHSVVEHSIAGSSLILSAEVATEVTAPALLETWYELGRLATLPPARGRAGAGPPVRAGLAAARHVDPGRAGRPGEHLRRLRAAAGLPGRARGRLAVGDPRRGRGRRRATLPGAGEGGHGGARRRERRGVAGDGCCRCTGRRRPRTGPAERRTE